MSAWMVGGLVVLVLGAEAGPRLSDRDFFSGLELTQPTLAPVRLAVERSDWPAARKAFAQHLRTRKTPRWIEDPSSPRRSQAARPDLEYANKVLAHQFRFSLGTWFDLGKNIDWSSNQMSEGESATVEWNSQLNRHFHFASLASAYRATGDEKYAAEVVAQMLDWIADCPVLVDRSGNSPYHHAWETLNTAIRAGDTWPNALYAILPSRSLGDDALVTIFKSLVEHARHLDRWPTRSGNWLTAESKGLYVIGTLLPEFREAKTWRQHAIERLYRQMQTDVYPDGLEIELALGYNNWVLANFAFVLELAKTNNQLQELPDDYLARLERMYDYLAYAAMPDGRTPGLNDSGHVDCARPLRLGAAYFPHRTDFLWRASRGKQGTPPEKTSVAFPYSGHYVMRSGWDPDARYLLFDAGPFGSGHQHEDKLHLIAFAYGRELLLDAGNYMYDRSRWRRYVLSTRGHNTIRVDGHDQNRRRARDTWVLPYPFQPLQNTWASTDQFDLAVGRYDSGYGPKREIQVVHTRAVVFIKPDYWVLVDTLQPADDQPHQYESLFHLNAEKAEIDKTTGAAITRNLKSANLVVWPVKVPGLTAEIVQGVQEEPVQGWANSPWRPVPTLVLRTEGRGKLHLITVLYPLAAGARCPVRSVQPLPVTTDNRPATDAVALQVDFHDGSRHTLLMAEKPGVLRRAGPLESDAMLHWTSHTPGHPSSFRYP